MSDESDDVKVKGISAQPMALVIEQAVQRLMRICGVRNEVAIRAVLNDVCRYVLQDAERDACRAAAKGIRQAVRLIQDPKYFEHRNQRSKKRRAEKAAKKAAQKDASAKKRPPIRIIFGNDDTVH